MKICMPVEALNGLDSRISANYRSAPALLVVDTKSQELTAIEPTAGSCNATPEEIDVIICAGGMGRGMFNRLRLQGIQVFNGGAVTVREALSGLTNGTLEEVTQVACCGGHDHEKESQGCGCNHHGSESKQHGCGCRGH